MNPNNHERLLIGNIWAAVVATTASLALLALVLVLDPKPGNIVLATASVLAFGFLTIWHLRKLYTWRRRITPPNATTKPRTNP